MKVLFVAQIDNVEPWYDDFLAAVGGRHEVVYYRRDADPAPQVAGVPVVVDLGGHASRELIAAGAAAGVKLWQVIGTGLDHTHVEDILGGGIRLANTPGPFSAVALAEHALFLMLALAKNAGRMAEDVRNGVMYRTMNDELAGKTLGLVGFGASGKELARRAAAMEMRVVALDAQPPAEDELALAFLDEFLEAARLPDLLRQSDYVSVHVPLTPQTRGLIGAEQLALMKPTAILVNVARGAIVDEGALADALRDGRLRGAGVDVWAQEPPDPANPLLSLPNVVATPHVAGVTLETSRRRGAAAAENVNRIAEGLPPMYEVT
jgi:phosphoglycerate dehydrogenase-like enzyme